MKKIDYDKFDIKCSNCGKYHGLNCLGKLVARMLLWTSDEEEAIREFNYIQAKLIIKHRK